MTDVLSNTYSSSTELETAFNEARKKLARCQAADIIVCAVEEQITVCEAYLDKTPAIDADDMYFTEEMIAAYNEFKRLIIESVTK